MCPFYSIPGESFEWLSIEEFSAKFHECWEETSVSFEKIEACPVFVEDDDESFNLFLAGQLTESQEIVKARVASQSDMYRSFQERGGSIRRLRIVGRPLTSYIADYESAAYEAAGEIGEVVSYVQESDIPEDLQLACRDMLVFDRNKILVHAYTPWGRMLGGYFSDSPSVLSDASTLLDRLDELASPVPPS